MRAVATGALRGHLQAGGQHGLLGGVGAGLPEVLVIRSSEDGARALAAIAPTLARLLEMLSSWVCWASMPVLAIPERIMVIP